jgi:CP family cyanate transporter-like MFS transporter
MMRDAHVSAFQASILTTLPILCLGLFGFVGPALARAIGAERSVLIMLWLVVAALVLRLVGTFPPLLLSAGMAGIAIGVLNVISPAIIKRDFPDRVGAAMGVYTVCLVSGACIAIGSTQPLSRALGSWSEALAFWALPAFVAAAIWVGQAKRSSGIREPERGRGLWRETLAWQVSIYFAVQSLLFYALIAWMPTMLRERGLSPTEAGLVMSLSMISQILPALFSPALAVRMRDQRFIAVVVIVITVIGYAGVAYAPVWQVWGWIVVMGLAQGANLAVALTLLVLRAGDSRTAATLSGMAQGVGYLVAACGPLLVGLLRAATGGWWAGELVMLAFSILCVLCALGAGRARTLMAG